MFSKILFQRNLCCSCWIGTVPLSRIDCCWFLIWKYVPVHCRSQQHICSFPECPKIFFMWSTVRLYAPRRYFLTYHHDSLHHCWDTGNSHGAVGRGLTHRVPYLQRAVMRREMFRTVSLEKSIQNYSYQLVKRRYQHVLYCLEKEGEASSSYWTSRNKMLNTKKKKKRIIIKRERNPSLYSQWELSAVCVTEFVLWHFISSWYPNLPTFCPAVWDIRPEPKYHYTSTAQKRKLLFGRDRHLFFFILYTTEKAETWLA